MTVDGFPDIAKPGTMFECDGHQFMSDGVGGNELNVVRLDGYGSRDQLAIDGIREQIENGNVKLVDTHTKDEIPVPQEALTVTMKFIAGDPALDGVRLEENIVSQSVKEVEDAMPSGAFNFRYRNE